MAADHVSENALYLAGILKFWKFLVHARIAQFSIVCRKTKTKVITLANQKGHRQFSKPIKTRSKYMKLARSTGNVREWITTGFGFSSDWLRKWREIFKLITKRSNAKPMQTQFIFDTQVKTALHYSKTL